jgi:hypothetical protein
MEFRPAKLDKFLLLISIITTASLIFFSIIFITKPIPYTWIFVILLISIPAFSFLLSPKTYYIQGGNFIIEKVIGRKISIPLNEIEEIIQVKDFNRLRPIRSMGNGGLFGYYGIFTTREYGNINCQLTSLKNVLLIKAKRGYFAISPERPERVLEHLKSMAGIEEKTEIPRPEPVKNKASFLILLLPDTIFNMVLIMVILLYPQLPNRIATHFDFFGHPNGFGNKISFLYTGIIPQVVLLLISFFVFFTSQNKFQNPLQLYFLIIIISLIQIFAGFTSFDIYWYNIHRMHLIPMHWLIIIFTTVIVIMLIIYNRLLTRKTISPDYS